MVVLTSSIHFQLFTNVGATNDEETTIIDKVINEQNKQDLKLGEKPAFSPIFNDEVEPSDNLEDGIWSWNEILGKTKLDTEDNRENELVRVKNNQIELIIGLEDDIDSARRSDEKVSFLLREYKLKSRLDELCSFVLEVPLPKLKEFLFDAEKAESICYVEPNYLISVQGTPMDPDYSLQWGPERINVPEAWDLETGDFSSVLVAIIDTGIDYNHPDLLTQYVPLGYDWINDDSNPMDDHGHGTHCAGVIAATSNNSIGIAGIANVKVMAEKFLGADGFGDTDDAAEAIIHAVDAGADILSNSWGGGGGSSSILENAFDYAEDHNVVIVGAAGNSHSTYLHYPSAFPQVISVSAIDSNDTLAYFSNYGSSIELAAPGVNIYSTILSTDGNYGNMSGTSMACPHVAGVAALIKSKFPTWSADQIRERLRDSAEDIGEAGWDEYFGYGLVNAFGAVKDIEPHDLKVAITSSNIIGVNTSASIQAMVKNIGLNDETDVELQIWINNSKVTFTTFSSLTVGENQTLDYYLSPISIGNLNITVYAVPMGSEIIISNNNQTKWVDVVDPNKSVGAIYTHNEYHFYYLKNYYQDLGYNFYEIYESFDEIEFDAFCCLIVGHSGFEWDATEITLIENFISDGGTVAAIGYNLNNDGIMAVADDYGIALANKEIIEGISSVTNPYHPVMQGVSKVQFPGCEKELLVSDSATPILFDPLGLSIIGASVNIGSGHLCVFISDIDDEIFTEDSNALIFENILKWSIPENNIHVSSPLLPDFLHLGVSINIDVTIANTGTSDESNVYYELLINDVIKQSENFSTILSGEEITASYSCTPTTYGIHKISATVEPISGETLILDNIFNITGNVPDPEITIGFFFAKTNLSLYFMEFFQNRGYNTFYIDQIVTEELLDVFSFLFAEESMDTWLPNEITAIENFIIEGGTFIGFAGGNAAADVTEKLGLKFGIESSYSSTIQGSTSNFDPNHPLMTAVSEIYLYYSSCELFLSKMATPFLWDSSNDHIVGASADVGLGHFCVIADKLYYRQYYDDNDVFLENILTWQQVEHELIIYLEEIHPEIGVQSPINISIYNSGLNDESNVVVKLWIDDVIVVEHNFASITSKELEYFTYNWIPLEYGVYNLTVNVSPVSGEQSVHNNHDEQFVSIVYNYHMNTDYTFDWIDPTLGTLLPLSYNTAVDISLPFSFQFYDKSFEHLYVSSNGWMSFDNTYPWQGSNVDYPTTEQNYDYSIGLFWHQLVATGDIYVISLTNPNRIVIAYSNMDYATYVPAGSFELILYESGEIILQYLNLTDIRSPTIGLNYGLDTYYFNSFEFSESSIDNFAILFSRDRQLHDLSVDLEVPKSTPTNSISEISASVTNIGINYETNIYLELWINNNLEQSSFYSSIASNQQYISTYDWTPTESGVYNITAYVEIISNESSIINNKLSLLVDVYNPPLVTLTNPNDGGVLSGIIQIQWTAINWESDDLLYSLFLLDGENLTTIAIDISSTNFYWNTTTIPNGSNYILKVTATDGVFECSDESDVAFEIRNIEPTTTTTKQSSISYAVIVVIPLVLTILQFVHQKKKKK